MNFLFDIGKVLLDFDFASSLERLVPSDVENPRERLERLLERKDDFESGKITVDDYTDWALGVLGSDASRDEFHHAWCDIFTPNEPMWQRVKQLVADGHKLVLFSNINGIHVPWIYDAYPEFEIFHGAVMSFQTGFIKPQAEIYQYAMQEYDFEPTETLYIDDLPQNVETGRAHGLRVWQYDLKNHAAFEEWLEEQLNTEITPQS